MKSFQEMLDETATVNVSELREVMGLCRDADLMLLVLGKPGIGKSDAAKQFAAETRPAAGIPRDCMLYRETRFSYAAPTDIRGWPHLVEEPDGSKSMGFALPTDYPREPGTVWHLEELTTASTETMKAGLQLFLEGRIGEYEKPDDTFIFASGNRLQDYADVETLAAPVMDRLVVLQLEVDLKTWLEWALDNPDRMADPRVPAFVNFFGQYLHNMPVRGENGAEEDWDGVSQFATPRSWEFVSRLMVRGLDKLPDNSRLAVLEGVVGKEAAVQFDLFLKAEKSLPSLDDILRHPSSAPVPEDLSGQACVCSALARKLGPDNAEALMGYMGRFGNREFMAYFLHYATSINPAVLVIPAVARAVNDNDLFL